MDYRLQSLISRLGLDGGEGGFNHRGRHWNRFQFVGVIEKGIKGGLAAQTGSGAGGAGLLPAGHFWSHGGIGLQGLARIAAIADRFALPDHLKKSQQTPRSVTPF